MIDLFRFSSIQTEIFVKVCAEKFPNGIFNQIEITRIKLNGDYLQKREFQCALCDRSLKITMTDLIENRPSELQDIEGIQVYDQETFEEDVSKKLDKQLEKQKRENDLKRSQKELLSVKANLAKTVLNLNKSEESLKAIVARGIVSDRKLQSMLSQQEDLKAEVEKLNETKKELETTIKDLESINKAKENDDKSDDEPSTSETVQEKSIRTGQMTAFGTVLASKTSKDDENSIAKRNFVKDWMDEGEDYDDIIGQRKRAKEMIERGLKKKKGLYL